MGFAPSGVPLHFAPKSHVHAEANTRLDELGSTKLKKYQAVLSGVPSDPITPILPAGLATPTSSHPTSYLAICLLISELACVCVYIYIYVPIN